jgi:hypothetical protein
VGARNNLDRTRKGGAFGSGHRSLMVGKGIDSANECPPVCESKYDEVHDRIDREDCSLHGDIEEKLYPALASQITFKKPATIAKRNKEDAA